MSGTILTARRLWALLALGLLAAALALAVVLAVDRFPRGLSVLVCLGIALLAAWYGVRRRGTAHAVALGVAGLFLAGGIALIFIEGDPGVVALAALAFVLSLGAAARAFLLHETLAPADPPRHPVLIYNPLSGDGKAAKFHLEEEAHKRGITTIELHRGDDLRELVRDAVRHGADAIAMAGGDGSQAVVAEMAAELDLPYACIPAGTRNHFALDLGVDRNDVVGALDALTRGGERRVDLAEVNGRTFVNNVSLGLYAEAVQQAGYREAKIRTLLATVPDVLGPSAAPPPVHWRGEDGEERAAALLVSNDPYRLGRALGSGTRPRLDRGRLGIAALGSITENAGQPHHTGMRQWSQRTFTVHADVPVPAGIDGEAAVLEPPLFFRSHPQALRVRIAPQHPGASPSAAVPDSPWGALAGLVRIAFGPGPGTPPVPAAN